MLYFQNKQWRTSLKNLLFYFSFASRWNTTVDREEEDSSDYGHKTVPLQPPKYQPRKEKQTKATSPSPYRLWKFAPATMMSLLMLAGDSTASITSLIPELPGSENLAQEIISAMAAQVKRQVTSTVKSLANKALVPRNVFQST